MSQGANLSYDADAYTAAVNKANTALETMKTAANQIKVAGLALVEGNDGKGVKESMTQCIDSVTSTQTTFDAGAVLVTNSQKVLVAWAEAEGGN